MQRTYNSAKQILKKNKFEGLALPKFQDYSKATVINSMVLAKGSCKMNEKEVRVQK